jgi:hypothetical protein
MTAWHTYYKENSTMDKNNALQYQQQLEESRQIWNAEAASFDDQPDHGLHDPRVLAAWTNLLKDTLPVNYAEL